MIDLRDLRENPERYRDSQRARGADVGLVDRIIEADESRRSRLQDFESLRAEQKSVSASVGRASQQDRPAVLARARELAVHVKEAEAAASAAASILDDLAHQLANLIEGAPAGGEEDYVVVRHEGPEPRDFAAEGFEPADHLALGEALDIIDTRRGAKVSGSRFYFLKGAGMRLELALMTAALDASARYGFVPMTTPTLVSPQVMAGTGFLGQHSDEIYYLPADDLYLTGTSEVALAGYHTDEILDLLLDLRSQLGLTILVITHEMHVVKRICDSVSLLEAGRIVESGPLTEVIRTLDGSLSQTLLGIPPHDPSVENGGQLIDVLASGSTADRPVVALTSQHFGVTIPIVAGSVEHLAGITFSHLRLRVPDGTDPDAVVGYLRQLGADAKRTPTSELNGAGR